MANRFAIFLISPNRFFNSTYIFVTNYMTFIHAGNHVGVTLAGITYVSQLGCAYESRMGSVLRSSRREAKPRAQWKRAIHERAVCASIESSKWGRDRWSAAGEAFACCHFPSVLRPRDVSSRRTQMHTQIIRVCDLPAVKLAPFTARRAGRNRVGREWRTYLHRYPCNYGFIENDASP